MESGSAGAGYEDDVVAVCPGDERDTVQIGDVGDQPARQVLDLTLFDVRNGPPVAPGASRSQVHVGRTVAGDHDGDMGITPPQLGMP